MNCIKGIKAVLPEIPGSLLPVLKAAAANGWGNVWQAQDSLRMKNLGGCCPHSQERILGENCVHPDQLQAQYSDDDVTLPGDLTVAPCLSDYSQELLVWVSGFRGTGHLPCMLSSSPPLSRTCTWVLVLCVCWLSWLKHFADHSLILRIRMTGEKPLLQAVCWPPCTRGAGEPLDTQIHICSKHLKYILLLWDGGGGKKK